MPFLVARHKLAKRVYKTIQDNFETSDYSFTSTIMYRARKIDEVEGLPMKKHFLFPPKDVVNEGRYNHNGQPVLYASGSSETCFFEVREIPSYIAQIRIMKELKILDMSNIDDLNSDPLLNSIIYSSLISAVTKEDDSKYKPEYVFSRFIADCALDIGFDGIKYPSTRCSLECFNYVLFKDGINTSTDIKLVGITKKYKL